MSPVIPQLSSKPTERSARTCKQPCEVHLPGPVNFLSKRPNMIRLQKGYIPIRRVRGCFDHVCSGDLMHSNTNLCSLSTAWACMPRWMLWLFADSGVERQDGLGRHALVTVCYVECRAPRYAGREAASTSASHAFLVKKQRTTTCNQSRACTASNCAQTSKSST